MSVKLGLMRRLPLCAIVCPEWKPRPLINQINLETNAVIKMEVGPPRTLYRRGLQITLKVLEE